MSYKRIYCLDLLSGLNLEAAYEGSPNTVGVIKNLISNIGVEYYSITYIVPICLVQRLGILLEYVYRLSPIEISLYILDRSRSQLQHIIFVLMPHYKGC